MFTPCGRRGRLAAIVTVLLLSPVYAAGQILTGDILGRVTDQSSAPVPGVVITVEGRALLTPRSVVTGSTGAYHVPALQLLAGVAKPTALAGTLVWLRVVLWR